MADLAFRVQHVIKTEIDVTQAQLSRNGIEVMNGVAQLQEPTPVTVTDARGADDDQATTIVIATGTKPAASPRVPINGQRSSTAIKFSKCQTLPRR